MTPEHALRDLQRLIQRKPNDTEPSVLRMRLPAELATSEHQMLGILADEKEAAAKATTALLGDPRFEHLAKPSEDVWSFVAECWADKSTDHVAAFVARHAAEVTQAVCYIPVEYLTVKDERRLPELALLPVSDPGIPPANPWFALDKPTGCVAAVPVSGSDYGKMAERARGQTRYLLRGLRLALGGRVHKRQLRFRLGIGYAFDERLTGWNRRDDEAYDVELPEDVLTDLLSNPVMTVPAEPGNDIERKATLAMTWMERACMTGHELVALLYRFFALEALLGDKSEGLKGPGLAFREMMLGHIVSGGFSHPNRTFFLYDEIRNAAVHGGDTPAVTPEEATQFDWAVRDALTNYLKLARDQDIQRRGKLLQVLDTHPDRADAIAWLRQHGGPDWTRYLDKTERTPC